MNFNFSSASTIFATVRRNNELILTTALTGIYTLKEIYSYLRQQLNHTSGLFTITLRNRENGHVLQQSLTFS